jgi:transposase
MGMYAKIRRMFYRDKLSISEIGRRTSMSRNTIKKWLKAGKEEGIEAVEPKYVRTKAVNKLTQFESTIQLALQTDSHRPKRDRRTALMLFNAIKKDGYSGSYSNLTRYIHAWRDVAAKVTSKSAFVPLHFQLGEAFQFDWSEEPFMIGGIHRKLLVAHTKLCASRAFFLSAYPSQSHEMLFDAHKQAFIALGGIPRRGIYDNMKTAVDKVKKGKSRIINTRFSSMAAHYLFEPDFCNVASGWEKGIVEKNVQDSRRRVWADAKQQSFSSFAALNAWLAERCQQLWNELPHPEYAGLTIADVLEQERAELMPMPTPFDGYVEFTALVSSTCLIHVDCNRYSVPCHLANKLVSVHQYANEVAVYADHQRVACHARRLGRDQTCYDWQHYILLAEKKPGVLRNGAPFATMPAPLIQLQTHLLRREGGDRMIAEVLAAVPRHGLEAVLVAVELVLESGAISEPHITNVLARLNQPERPKPVATSLQLNEEPLADTSRYDRLHQTAEDEVEVEHV